MIKNHEADIDKVITLDLVDFLNDDLGNYAFYKVLTQIPHILDGLTITQRKIIHVMSKNKDKTFKTAQTYSYLLNDTKYVHGDVSVYNTTNNMAALYKNNINLLTPKSNFGNRTIPSASAPRYTESKYSKIAQLIFNNIDSNLLIPQIFENEEIEPYYLLPSLPLGLINGNSGIAMGYKADIFPRNPLEILNTLRSILRKETKRIDNFMVPWIPYFNGVIEKTDCPKKWIFKGIIEKVRSTKNYGFLRITEIPFKSRDRYVEKNINGLIDTGVIKSWDDACEKNQFLFDIKVPIEIYEKPHDELLELFGLVVTKVESLTFINRDDISIELKEYDSIANFFKDWISMRASFYKKRKEFILSKLEKDLMIAQNRAKFIKDIIDDNIIIKKRKKSVIEKDLGKLEYVSIDDSYDYLLNMSIWNLTSEKISELNKKIRNIKLEIKRVNELNPIDIWLDDLDNLEELIIKEIDTKTLKS